MNEAPRADPIFRVYATDGKRLLVRAVDADHADPFDSRTVKKQQNAHPYFT